MFLQRKSFPFLKKNIPVTGVQMRSVCKFIYSASNLHIRIQRWRTYLQATITFQHGMHSQFILVICVAHFSHLLAHLADRMDLDGEGLRYLLILTSHIVEPCLTATPLI